MTAASTLPSGSSGAGGAKFPGLGQQLDEYGLADILRVVGIFQIGVAKPENGVRVGIRQAFGLLRYVHDIHSFVSGAFNHNTIQKP